MDLRNPFHITPLDLFAALGTPDWPQVLDVRAADIRAVQRDLPAARAVEARRSDDIVQLVDMNRPIVVACKAGHERSQALTADLRASGAQASMLTGGTEAWSALGLPMIARSAADKYGGPGRAWVTRRRPKIDRVACPWLINRFLDPTARCLFVETEEVLATAERIDGIAFDTPGAPLEHDGPLCTFDVILRELGLDRDAHLAALAVIVRAADTDRLDLASEAAGYRAVSLGLSALAGDDDHAMLRHGFVVLDGLYAFLRHAQGETHSWTARQ